MSLNQRGDTLLEVVIALTIIGSVIFASYALSSQAFRLGQSARERTQAAQLLQEQAEGLRSLRDTAISWDDFKGQFQGSGGSVDIDSFHVAKTEDRKWQLNNGETNPINPVASYYSIVIDGELTGATEDMLEVAIKVSWPRFGNGPEEETTLFLHLTDQEIPLISL